MNEATRGKLKRTLGYLMKDMIDFYSQDGDVLERMSEAELRHAVVDYIGRLNFEQIIGRKYGEGADTDAAHVGAPA